MTKTHLGIMVRFMTRLSPPFIEQYLFRAISMYGRKNNIDVTVFSPVTVDWKNNMVQGYRLNPKTNGWIKGVYPIPKVLYDRIAYSNRSQVKQYRPFIDRLVAKYDCILLGRGLPGKWVVHNMIKDIEEIKPHIPETICLEPGVNWMKKLQQHKALIFKPASGSHGKGVFKLSHQAGGFSVKGRNARNTLFHKQFNSYQSLNQWIKSFIGARVYVIQPYLELSTAVDQPFDIRILFQKTKDGVWAETGRAVRLGKKSSLTSNLDGGGTALNADLFLKKHFSKEQVKKINEDIANILNHLPTHLEKKHGALIELGIDIGIDRSGHVWILEVNSKPGRKSFKIAQNDRVFFKSLVAPIQYADYMVSQAGGNL